MRKFFLYAALVAALLSSCTETLIIEADDSSTANQMLVSTFITSCAAAEAVAITQSYSITGVITTSDSTSNFYKSFIVDDGTAAIEVMCGFYDVYTNYKKGYLATIDTKGLTLGVTDYGVYQLGYGSSDVYDVEYFGHRAIAEDYITVTGSHSMPFPVTTKTIAEISRSDIARTIKIEGLKLVDQSQTVYWAPSNYSDYVSEGTVEFEDASGNTIRVKTSGYASFADEAVPTSTLDITGILFWDSALSENGYYLKINDTESLYEVY